MFVYLNEPMGYTEICGKRIYGECYAQGSCGPTNIPYSEYIKYRDRLHQRVITQAELSERFGGEFPQVEFTYDNMLEAVDFDTLGDIAIGVGIKYVKSKKEPTRRQRQALKKSIILALDGEV